MLFEEVWAFMWIIFSSDLIERNAGYGLRNYYTHLSELLNKFKRLHATPSFSTLHNNTGDKATHTHYFIATAYGHELIKNHCWKNTTLCLRNGRKLIAERQDMLSVSRVSAVPHYLLLVYQLPLKWLHVSRGSVRTARYRETVVYGPCVCITWMWMEYMYMLMILYRCVC